MRTDTTRKRPGVGDTPKILAIDGLEQARRIQDAVGHRAFEIFESRGSIPGHELEDWHQAETEIAGSRCSGQMKLDDSLWVNTDTALFEPGSIEIWVAPRKLTICGKPRVLRESSGAGREVPGDKADMIFHVIDLNCEIDPSRVTARFDNAASLEIVLGKAQGESPANRETKAAAA